MSIIVETPFQNFTGLDGKPLTNGKVYIGQVGTDPTVFANQIPVFWDEALTIPASQPLTTNAGYIVRFGTPARVYANGLYSMTVKNSNNVLVYYASKAGQQDIIAELAAPDGASKIGYSSPSASTPSVRTVRQKLGERVSLLDYLGADPTGANDNSALIQKAVDEAAAAGIYTISVPGIFRSDVGIKLSGGMTLDGEIAPGYYAGMPFYASANAKTGPRGRIIAGAAITGGLIQFDETLYSAHGFGLRNIIIDANKLADNGIAMNPAVLTERVCRFNDLLVQGSVLDGIRMQNTLVQMWNNVTVASCHGFGVNFASGISDSQIVNLYVHTCDGGGVQIGDGCTNIHFRGGKIEDNYANGMQLSTLVVGNSGIYMNDFSINTNNGDGISNNGATIFATGCTFYGHDKSPDSAAIYNNNGTVIMNGGTIFGNNYNFQQNGGIIDVQGGTAISNAVSRNVVQVAGALSVQGDILEGVPVMRNPGARRRTTGIGGSSSASVTFPNALASGMTGAYFDMKSFNLSVTYSQYPQTPDPAQSFFGQVIVGEAGGVRGAAVKTVSGAGSTAYIAGVTASVSGDDIIVTVSTGASWGNVSGHTTAYISLEDIGHNVYK